MEGPMWQGPDFSVSVSKYLRPANSHGNEHGGESFLMWGLEMTAV